MPRLTEENFRSQGDHIPGDLAPAGGRCSLNRDHMPYPFVPHSPPVQCAPCRLRVCASMEQEGDASGSTALVALFDTNENRLLVANVGDSRCVVSRAGVARRISNDHCLDRPQERERVAVSFVSRKRLKYLVVVGSMPTTINDHSQ